MRKITTAGLAAAMLFASTAYASSHREAPLISEDPSADSTDVYMFLSPDVANTVTLIANYIPLEEPSGGPNFHNFSPSVLYEIKIDNDGDAVEDIIYQFRFRTTIGNTNTFLYNTGLITNINDATFNMKQFYDVTRVDIANNGAVTTTVIGTNVKVPPARVGPRSVGDINAYATLAGQAITTVNPVIAGTARTHKLFAGPRDEGFFLDLGAIFDLINSDRILGFGADPNAQVAVDYTAGFNVHSIAIQVPIQALTNNGQLAANGDAANAVIGMWTSASRQKHTVLRRGAGPDNHGGFVQVSRLSLPLINEVVIPLSDKDKFNRTEPKDDVANFAGFIVNPELAALTELLYGVTRPKTNGVPDPRNDLVALISFLPDPNGTAFAGTGGGLTKQALQPADLLRLNVASAPTPINTGNRLGVIASDVNGFPNGRRIQDDVVDVLERVIGGSILVTGFNIVPNNILNDGVIQNDVPLLTTFPFLGTPHEGFVRVHQ
jgi:hypothetical protein